MQKATAVAAALILSACGDPAWDPVAATEVATSRANETHEIGQRLRDRCARTDDVDDCRAWLDFQREIERDWGIVSYPQELERWERTGPY